MQLNTIKVARGAATAAVLVLGGFLLGSALGGGEDAVAEPAGAAPTATPAGVWYEPSIEGWFEAPASSQQHKDVANGEPAPEETPAPVNGSASAPQPTQTPVPAPASPTPTPVAPAPQPTAVPVEPTPEATPDDNEAPFVTGSKPPADTGLPPETSPAIAFSEPVDRASAEAAFQISHGGDCGSFSWFDDDKFMVYDPCDDLPYGADVVITVDATFEDLEGKQAEVGFSDGFKIVQQTTLTFYSEPGEDGYIYSPQALVIGERAYPEGQTFYAGKQIRGFVKFELLDIPQDSEVQAATLWVKQAAHDPQAYSDETGALLVSAIRYGMLGAGNWGSKAIPLCAKICLGDPPLTRQFSASATNGWKQVDMTDAVRHYVDHKAYYGGEAAFRLQFAKECATYICSDVKAEFYAGESAQPPRLIVTFLHP